MPPRIGGLIRPHVPALSDEIIEAIRERVPAYRRPLRGRFGAGIRGGVEEALAQFVDLIADPELDRSGQRRGLSGARPRRVPRATLARRAARRLPARRAGRLAPGLGDRDRGRGRPPHAGAARRGRVRLHRRALGALGRWLRGGAVGRRPGRRERMRRRLATLLLDPEPDEAAVRGRGRRGRLGSAGEVAALAWERRRSAAAPAPAASTLVAEPGDDAAAGSRCSPTPRRPGSRDAARARARGLDAVGARARGRA